MTISTFMRHPAWQCAIPARRSALRKCLVGTIPLLLLCSSAKGGDADFRGQLSLLGRETRLSETWQTNVTGLYFPELTYTHNLSDDAFVDIEGSCLASSTTDFTRGESTLKLYRLKGRYADTQTEIRLGLQTFNFGPAKILRSLMWFDRVDPRDPLKMTDGIYGLRIKHTWADNSEIWLWGLYGNTQTKGYEVFPTARQRPEFGARVQLPVLRGEVGATANFRRVEAGPFEYQEDRYGLDGRWDVEVGIWFEASVQQNRTALLPERWNSMTTFGMDYTLGFGLLITAEHMASLASQAFLGGDQHAQISAVSFSYPVSVLDNVAAFVYYSWESRSVYQFYQWQRTYDAFLFSVSVFHFPATGAAILGQNTNVPSSGYGVQLMAVYNH